MHGAAHGWILASLRKDAKSNWLHDLLIWRDSEG